MARGADRVKAVKGQLAEQPAPKLADVMALQRTLVFLLMSKAQTEPELLAKVIRMTKPLLQYEELETRICKFDLVERKFRDQVAEREQELEAERKAAKGGNVISEETKRKIWRELSFFPYPEPGDSDQEGPNESEQVQAGPGEKEPVSERMFSVTRLISDIRGCRLVKGSQFPRRRKPTADRRPRTPALSTLRLLRLAFRASVAHFGNVSSL